MADDGVKLSTKEEKTFAELKALGGVKIPVLKKNVNLYQMPIETIEEFATVDSICETQAELLAEITSSTIHTILWKGNTTLIDFVATAGTFKLIYCQHYSLLGKNSTLVAPAGKNITIYGDIDCATPATGGFSWTLNSTATSSIKCKWIRNSGVTGKVGIDAGTVLYERIEAGIFSSVVGGAFLKQEFWDNTNDVHKDVSDNQNIWYLDTVNGLDANSGLSRSAPKKTGDAVVIACKTAGKTTGRLVVVAGTGTVTFTATNWVNTAFPFFDVVFETAYTKCTWNGIVASGIFKIYGGVHVFNDCNCGGENIVDAKNCTVNRGTWAGLINFDLESYITVNGLTSTGELCINAPSLDIPTAFMIGGTAKIQVNELSGAGSIYPYANSEVSLDVHAGRFSLEGTFSFPNQLVDSSIKITAAQMQRTATTKLLYLGANTGVTVNYQLVVDTMGSIVPMEIGNPAGTVAGKVIELLKYENKVDAEIIRATAAEALKANKLTTVNNSTSTDYTFAAADILTIHVVNSATAATRTVPSDTTAPTISIGDSIEIVQLGTGQVTLVADTGVTILTSLTLKTYGQNSVIAIRKIAANTWVLTGERAGS